MNAHLPPLVLLHGLGRTARSLRPIAADARRRGVRAVSIDYPSRRRSLAELARSVAARIDAEIGDAELDAVTHSMGGIVLRVAVAEGLLPVERVRRVVMLGPPNRGSELAELLRPRRWFRATMGPAGTELGTGDESTVLRLPPVPFTVGVIAGSRSLNPFSRWIFAAPSDGKVAVERTRVEGMTDFLVVPCPHPVLMWCPAVRAAVQRFLAGGRFGT